MQAGGGAPCVLNAANEVSVQYFLDGKVGFADIPRVNETVLAAFGHVPAPASLEEAVALDAQARQRAEAAVASR